jgi:adenylylsulfate kinase
MTTSERATGATVWLTGLPSAGKTTIASAAAHRMRGMPVEILDGDEMRATLTAGLGFSRTDRETNVERIGFVAELLARNGVLVLAPVVSPHACARDRVRRRHAASGTPFFEVHVATPLEECSARDVKGLYGKQRCGELRGLTGVDDIYEAPPAAELRLDTCGRSVEDCVAELLSMLGREEAAR